MSSNLHPLTQSEIKPEATFSPVPLTKSEAALDPIPLQSGLITSLSNTSSSIQPFMLTLPVENDPCKVLLARTFYIKWGFVAIHNYQRHGQHSMQSLCLRFFLMLHFKTRERVFSNWGELMGIKNGMLVFARGGVDDWG